ncbi:MAG: ATP-dependent metallopeptidase FtsH/Yme1/Tma family protein [Calditrichaeota bacterium]|nr:ATP-dependent metallopeptidase FtsH/Yme1/Tma family protein [Calditrichota bacterium]
MFNQFEPIELKTNKPGQKTPPKRPTLPRRSKNQKGNAPGGNNAPNDENGGWKRYSRSITIWILIILGSILFAQAFSNLGRKGEQVISYSEYMRLLEANQIERAVIKDHEFHGVLKHENATKVGGRVVNFKRFKVMLPFINKDMLAQWDKAGIKYDFREKSMDWLGYLLNLLPWIALAAIWFYLLKRMQGGGSKGIFSFGKSRAKLMMQDKLRVTFDDVAGADEAKQELLEIIDFLRDPGKFQKLGGHIPKGALLLGPPGTGKTLLAKAVAGEAGVPFFSISGADFVEMFVGVGASRVRDLFEQGKKNAPCIIFIDEIDAVGRHRGAGLGGGHDEREQTLNQLLVEMDGFDSNEGVILIAATNRPDVLDQALLRPGRFDRQIVVDRPDVRGREGILRVHTRKIPLDKDVDLEIIAKGTPGFSGADLANLVNEAALMAARKNKKRVQMEDFEEAKDKVLMGVERKSMIISDDEKRSTAYHESGHVLVAKLIPGSDPVHKVTIIPRGRALGITSYLPIDERHSYSKEYLETRMVHLLGGRAAEKIVLNHYTTGAGNDIERATEMARKMVCEWGMSEKLGPVTFGKKDEEIFIGREIAQHRDYSEETAKIIDGEVKRIVQEAADKAEKLLRDNVDLLHRLADALLEYEILDGHQIDQILAGEAMAPPPKKKKAANAARSKPRRRKKTESTTPVAEKSEKSAGSGMDEGEHS